MLISSAVVAAGVAAEASAQDDAHLCWLNVQSGMGETFGYSPHGLIAHTNQLGHTNFFAYEVAGRKTAETNANGEVTHFE